MMDDDDDRHLVVIVVVTIIVIIPRGGRLCIGFSGDVFQRGWAVGTVLHRCGLAMGYLVANLQRWR